MDLDLAMSSTPSCPVSRLSRKGLRNGTQMVTMLMVCRTPTINVGFHKAKVVSLKVSADG